MAVPTISAESFDFEAWVLLEDLNLAMNYGTQFGEDFRTKGYNKYDNLLKVTEDDLKEMNCDKDYFRKRLLLAIKRLAEGLQTVAYGLLVSWYQEWCIYCIIIEYPIDAPQHSLLSCT